MCNLNVGCGNIYLDDCVNIDLKKICVMDKSHMGEKLRLDAVMDARVLGIRSEVAEKIICSHLIEHMFPEDGVLLLQEFYRVLVPGGQLVLYQPNLDWLLYQPESNSSLFDKNTWIGKQEFLYNMKVSPHHSMYNPVVLTELLEKLNFTNITRLRPRYVYEFGLVAHK